MSKLLDVKQVADLIGCSWRTVLRWAGNGEFPSGFKVGGLRRWTLDSVQDHIDRLPPCCPAAAE